MEEYRISLGREVPPQSPAAGFGRGGRGRDEGLRGHVAGMDWPSPFVESSYAYPAGLWYNIAAFSEVDDGLRNRAGGPSEMMLI